MFAIPGIVLLIAIIYARPQEFLGPLQAVPILYVAFAMTIFGGALDLRLGNTRLRSTPLLPWIGLFLAWSFVTVIARAPSNLPLRGLSLMVCAALYLVIAHGVQTLRAFGAIAGTVLALVLLISVVGVEQGFAATGCVVVDESSSGGEAAAGKPDGRPCDTVRACYLGDPEPGAEYVCEHVGWFGTTSIGKGRVRYRGVLQDPNELALAVAIGLPLAFGMGRTRGGGRALAALSFALVLACTVLSRSRGGQLVFMTVLAAYFVKRFGFRGLGLGAILALPLLLLGGRSGAEATSSTLERIDAWSEALSMFRSHPLMGVGLGQFGEYHYMTAHNSYLLALAELGLPGMLLFSIVVYMAAKIPVEALGTGEPAIEAWAMALLAAFAGLGVGIFFLSFAYHYVLWIYIGLSGALYSAIRTHNAAFRVRFGWRDLLTVVIADAAIVAAVFLYTREKLA